MYEMQGPCPASRHRSAGCPATLRLSDLPLVAAPAGSSGFPALPAPPGFPRTDPVSSSDVFLLPRQRAAQGPSGSNLKILWPSTSYPQELPCCPPEQAPFHRAIHNFAHRMPPGRGSAVSPQDAVQRASHCPPRGPTSGPTSGRAMRTAIASTQRCCAERKCIASSTRKRPMHGKPDLRRRFMHRLGGATAPGAGMRESRRR